MASGEKTTNDITPQKVSVSDKQPRSKRHEDELKPDSKLEATSKDEELNCERSSLFLVKDGKESSKSYYQDYFRKRGFKGEVVRIRKPANESSKDVIVEVETRLKEEVDMSEDLKSKASTMMSDTTTITLSGPYLPEIMKVIPVLMENDPFLMGRGLHVDDSTTNMITKIDNIEDEQEQKSVKVNGPFRLVGYLRKLIRQTLVQYIDVVDNPQGKTILEIAETVANESDGPDGGSDLDQPELDKEMDPNSTLSSSKREGEGFHHSANSDRHKSSTRTSVHDQPHGITVATQTDTTTPEAAIVTGKKGSKVTISETIRGGNTSGGFHPNASTDHQNSNVGTSVDDTSVAGQTDTTTPKATVLTGKEVSKGIMISEATSKEPDVVEIPLSKTHRRLVVKKSRFLYEDTNIKIAAICSEMGFTEGLNKNLNDQLKDQLQQTVDRRYQNGKPDKFDVFTVHCPPSTIGCRYLVIANILDHTLGSHQDHHKFLQQILHSVFKEADTLEMPTVAIAIQSFAIGGFPADTILPSFIRILDQYQFTNDEFFSDVRVVTTSAENFSSLVAVSEHFLGKSLTSRHTSSKKTASDLPNSEHDNVHLSSQGMMDKGERRVVPPPAYASNLNPAVIHLMIKCRMINQFLTISSDFTRVDVLKGAERYLEDFSTSYQNLLNGQRILQESVKLRETLLHDTLALLASTLEAQFPQAVFDFDVGKNAICFLSLDQSILEAVDKTVQDFLSEIRTVPKEHAHTNGATEQSAITIPMPYNRSLTVKKGDLVKEEVTAIVNAANEWLKHEGGVAYAIDRASRGHVQRESDRMIGDNRQCPIPTGQVAVTGAGGDLRCKAVIHAVGPDARVMKIDNCKRLLKQACESTLRCAEGEGMHSIALPPISSGIYAMPKDLVARILIDTILQYPYSQDSSLMDIRIVIIDGETFQPFLQYAQKVLDSSPFVFTSDSTFPPSSAPTYSATQKSSSPPASSIPTSEVDVVEIPLGTTHRRLVLKKSHFLYEDADIKIAAICSEMGFTEGLNKNLNDQLKDQLQQTVDRRYQNGKPDKFDVFTVHCSPSTIGCRYFVVANILDNTLGSHQDNHKFLQQILHSVFKEADTLEMPSVAIVPTTFAIGGFPEDSILTSFIRMLRQYQFTNDEFLTDVRFIAATDVEFGQLLAVAERFSGTKLTVPLNVGTTEPEEQEQKSDQNQGSSFLSSLGSGLGSAVSVVTGLFSFGTNSTQGQPKEISIPLQADRRLTLKMGNLIEEDVDALINPANGHLKHVSGIASAINKASNGNVQRESDSLIDRIGGPISPGRVAVTAAGGKLHCKSIIHAVVPYSGQLSLEKYKEFLEEACKNTLSIADQDKMLSIAFPPFISLLDKTTPRGPIAQIFIDTMLKYPYKRNSSLKDIRIVISDVETLQPFQQYMQQVAGSSPSISSGASTSPQFSTAPPSSTMHPSAAFPSSTHQQPSSPRMSSSIPTSKPEEVEIPFDKTHRKLIIKKGRFLYEDADIKIAAICSEMGFTKGLNKNLNDQLKGQLQQTVDRRYQNGKPDKFDVFTVHCPPSTIGCRYLVVANILDRTLGSRQDHHKFLQQILHSVFKEADTLEMPSVAIIPSTFAISGFPRDTILPLFIRMFSQYQFTNDEFLTDVRFLATDDTGLASLCAAAERTVGRALSLEQKSNPVTLAPKFSSPPDQSSGYGSKVAKIPAATVITGDIAQYAADAIVVPVSPSLDMKGATSKAINSISKGAVLKCVSRLKWKLSEGNVIPLPCVQQWNIQSKYLFFLCRAQYTNMEILSQACKKALETAKSYHLQSIAFPPITSHQKKDLLAKAMMDVIKDFNEKNQGLLSATIVVKKDDPIHKHYLQIMESTVSHWECKESAL